jgi:hypothetical protein
MFRTALLALATAGVALSAAPTLADPVALRHRSLPVVAGDPPGAPGYGALSGFLRALRRAGHTCNYSSGDHSASISCDPELAGPESSPARIRSSKVFIGIEFIPTRGPDLARISSIRAQGVNSPALPASEMADFMNRYLKRR